MEFREGKEDHCLCSIGYDEEREKKQNVGESISGLKGHLKGQNDQTIDHMMCLWGLNQAK